ncbi:MAG: RDD family protein [Thermodesulfovibrionales bacterium]|nr:RDD family protein [Thermodesulfovibrionales bacterium]
MTGEPKTAGVLLRVVSKFIDVILVFAAAEALPKVGWFAGVGYLLISDGLFEGRSLGKMLTGLRVVSAGGSPCSIRDSILRNSLLGAGLLLWKLPLIGWLFCGAAGAFEFILLLGSKEGKRLGDEIAKTSVLELVTEKES